MTFDSASALRRLQALLQQIAEAPRLGESLRAAWDGHDLHEARCVTIDAKRHMNALAMTTALLKAQVLATDGLGAALESLSELALRAVRMVVLTELGTLCELVRAPSAHDRSRALSWGRLGGIENLTVQVWTELDGITDLWRRYRGMAGVERAAYRAALHAAHSSWRQLGDSSELARFVRAGRTRSDWPELQSVCARMDAALMIRIDIDPELPLLTPAQPVHLNTTGRTS
jgi:hypothetical protein